MSSGTSSTTQGSPTYGFYVTLMMEKRAGTCHAVPCERSTLALLFSRYPYGKSRGLHLIAAEWFSDGSCRLLQREIQIIFVGRRKKKKVKKKKGIVTGT